MGAAGLIPCFFGLLDGTLTEVLSPYDLCIDGMLNLSSLTHWVIESI